MNQIKQFLVDWITVNDSQEEEKDSLGSLTPKQVNGAIAKVAKQWLHSK